LREVLENQEPRPDCPLVLYTIHASKGLEYDRVVLIDVVDGVFPAVSEPKNGRELDVEDQMALEEDRRLFYVRVTRAREKLELLCCEYKFGEPFGASSTFIAQLLGEEPKPESEPAPAVPSVQSAAPTAAQVAVWEKDYIPGTWVVRKKFGSGILREKTGSIATIAFLDDGKARKVDLPACLKKGLIRLDGFRPHFTTDCLVQRL
jgi:DNA helicase-2/ATP-dependent DNA helicase PcrA